MEQNDMVVESEDWIKFIDMVQASNTEFAKGIVGDVTKAVWSNSDDATIFGGYQCARFAKKSEMIRGIGNKWMNT